MEMIAFGHNFGTATASRMHFVPWIGLDLIVESRHRTFCDKPSNWPLGGTYRERHRFDDLGVANDSAKDVGCALAPERSPKMGACFSIRPRQPAAP